MRNTLAVPYASSQRARLRELRRHQRESAQSPSVFASNVGRCYPAPGFSRLVECAATAADLGIKVHVFRHACGYKLANDGHDTRDPGVPRASQHSEHDTLHCPSAAAVQGILSRLIHPRSEARAVHQTPPLTRKRPWIHFGCSRYHLRPSELTSGSAESGWTLPAKLGRAVLDRTSTFARDLQGNILLLPCAAHSPQWGPVRDDLEGDYGHIPRLIAQ
jgi:hypothetical protein